MTALKFYSKPRRKRIGPEANLQMAVIEHLRIRGVPYLIFFSVPNEGKRSPAAALHLKRLGMLPGVADLCILVPGAPPAFLELKSPTGDLSDNQVEFARLAQENGSRWRVCSDIADALAQLEAWGALLPAKQDRRKAA